MQLDHHPKGDEIQDYLKDITGKSSDAALAGSPFVLNSLAVSSVRISPSVLSSSHSGC